MEQRRRLLDDDAEEIALDDVASDGVAVLASSATEGLTQEEANRRFLQHGPNSIPVSRPGLAKRALLVLVKPISLFLMVVAVFSGLIADWTSVAVVVFLLVLNTIFILVEETQAEKAVDALRKKLGLESFVRRSGEWMLVPNEILVPGDLIKVKLGDMIPADCELRDGRALEVDQSSITGESLPVHRGAGERVLSGSIVMSGAMTAIVTGTGAKSMLGNTLNLVRACVCACTHFVCREIALTFAHQMEVAKQTTRLQQLIFRIALGMAVVSLVLCTVLVAVKLALRSGPPLVVLQVRRAVRAASRILLTRYA